MTCRGVSRAIMRSLLLLFAAAAFPPATAAIVESGRLYTVEQRGDAGQKDTFAWKHAAGSDQLVMDRIIYKAENDIRFEFTPDGDGFHKISSILGPELLSAGGGDEGSDLFFSADDGSDDQLWRVQDLGTGYVRLISKSTNLAIAFSDDTVVSNDHTDSVAVLALHDSGVRTEWRLTQSIITPEKVIGVNQNGWAPSQTKIAVLTREEGGSAPSFEVSGPQTLSGTTQQWGEKWGLNFYQADISSLTAVGHYTISIDGITQSFSIVSDPFLNVRGERGGTVTWGSIVEGILEAQEVKAPGDTLEEAIGHEGVPTYLGSSYTLDGGYYDASSLDNKIYRTAQIYRSLAIGFMETSDQAKRDEIIGTLREGVDWLHRTQEGDGSWHLGKVRVTGDDYYWSTDTDPGGVSQVIIALATTANALATVDQFYSSKALTMAENAWEWVMANSDDSKFYDPSGSYFGSQSTLIGAAIELYLATDQTSPYKEYADSHILEAEYKSNSGLYRSTGSPWPGTATKRDFYIGIYLSRYHPVADSSVKNAIELQLNNLVTYYVDKEVHSTPWNIPEGLGAVQVSQGWFRSMASYSHAMIEIARVLNTQKPRDAAMAAWDAITGNNPFGSNCFAGGRGTEKIPLWHQPWGKMTGAVVPGPMCQPDVFGNYVFTFAEMGYQHTEQVVMTSVPVIPFWAIANKLIPPLSGNQAPEFYANEFSDMDATVDEMYASSLAENVFDSEGDFLSFMKLAGPAWLNVESDGSLYGVPSPTDEGSNIFTVQVSDGSLSSQATLVIDVTSFRATFAPTPAPTIDPDAVTIVVGVAEDAYTRANNPVATTGGQNKLELRTDAPNDAYSRTGYLKFNVAGITTEVLSVKLFIYSIDEADPITIYSVPSTWDESSLCWSNKPALGAVLGTMIPTIGWYSSVDLTGHIQGDGTYSVALKETGDSVHKVGSKEGGAGAYLEIAVLPTVIRLPVINVAEDTYVHARSRDKSFGSSDKMQLRTDTPNDVYSRTGYLKFHVTGITTNVVRVKLYIYSVSEADPINVYGVLNSAWSESSLTWNTQPSIGQTKLATMIPTTGSYSYVDITDHIQGDGTYSFALKETGDSVHEVGTKEGGQGAYLEVDVVEPET